MVISKIPFYNKAAKYLRSKLKPRLLLVGAGAGDRAELMLNHIRGAFSIFQNSSTSIKTVSPHKYDLVFFLDTSLWTAQECLLDFNQVVLFIDEEFICASDESRVLSAGTLVCESAKVFVKLTSKHPRVFLVGNPQELSKHLEKNDPTPNYRWVNIKDVLIDALQYSKMPKFRNDDISAENDLSQVIEFCDILYKYGFSQIHGVLLKGRSSEVYWHEGQEVAYENTPSIAKIPNDEIRRLSVGWDFSTRTDLIEYLSNSPDEIAFHGLYHTDHSTMSLAELRSEMTEGLEILRRLFPSKAIRYFIAPFNRTSELTYRVAGELGLRVLALDGVHLEAGLANLRLEPRTWYRYHHHRFYPESKFPHFNLSLQTLDAAFSRQARSTFC
jgi:hypothetical protein